MRSVPLLFPTRQGGERSVLASSTLPCDSPQAEWGPQALLTPNYSMAQISGGKDLTEGCREGQGPGVQVGVMAVVGSDSNSSTEVAQTSSGFSSHNAPIPRPSRMNTPAPPTTHHLVLDMGWLQQGKRHDLGLCLSQMANTYFSTLLLWGKGPSVGRRKAYT